MRTDNPLIDLPVLESMMPIQWRWLDSPLTNHDKINLQQKNKQLLAVLLGLNQPSNELEEDLESHKQELRNLQFKMDLMLSWLGQLLLQNHKLPEARLVKLSSRGIQVSLPEVIEVDSLWVLECFIESDFPQALSFVGRVSEVLPTSTSNFVILFNFQDIGGEVSDQLDKYIFRQHRRLIAHQKSKSS